MKHRWILGAMAAIALGVAGCAPQQGGGSAEPSEAASSVAPDPTVELTAEPMPSPEPTRSAEPTPNELDYDYDY